MPAAPGPATDTKTVTIVVKFVGTIALLGVVGTQMLVLRLLSLKSIDPAAIAAVSGVNTLAASALAFLGGMLVSTRSVDPEQVQAQGAAEGYTAATSDLTELALATGGDPAPAPPSPPPQE